VIVVPIANRSLFTMKTYLGRVEEDPTTIAPQVRSFDPLRSLTEIPAEVSTIGDSLTLRETGAPCHTGYGFSPPQNRKPN
jgi:hypothetical protein